jgi:hypothetical protein
VPDGEKQSLPEAVPGLPEPGRHGIASAGRAPVGVRVKGCSRKNWLGSAPPRFCWLLCTSLVEGRVPWKKPMPASGMSTLGKERPVERHVARTRFFRVALANHALDSRARNRLALDKAQGALEAPRGPACCVADITT